jgi:hypothetical protein
VTFGGVSLKPHQKTSHLTNSIYSYLSITLRQTWIFAMFFILIFIGMINPNLGNTILEHIKPFIINTPTVKAGKESTPLRNHNTQEDEDKEDKDLQEQEHQPEDKDLQEQEHQPEDKGLQEQEHQPEDKDLQEQEPQPEDKDLQKQEHQPEDKDLQEQEPQPEDKGLQEQEHQPEDQDLQEQEPQPEDKDLQKQEHQPEDKDLQEQEPQPEDKGLQEQEHQPEDKDLQEQEPQPEDLHNRRSKDEIYRALKEKAANHRPVTRSQTSGRPTVHIQLEERKRRRPRRKPVEARVNVSGNYLDFVQFDSPSFLSGIQSSQSTAH